MDSLKYPLYFIDYETYQLAIPENEGTRPYQQLPFQYSLHIIKEKGGIILWKFKQLVKHILTSVILVS